MSNIHSYEHHIGGLNSAQAEEQRIIQQHLRTALDIVIIGVLEGVNGQPWTPKIYPLIVEAIFNYLQAQEGQPKISKYYILGFVQGQTLWARYRTIDGRITTNRENI